jgi:glutathione reductase (NADPH)
VQGAELGITSDQLFKLEKQPRSVLIVGGGYIGVETAAMFAGLGSHVILAMETSRILPGFEPELAQALQDHLSAIGVELMPKCNIAKLENQANHIVAHCHQGSTLNVDCVLWAIGRRPNSLFLNLADTSIATDAKGFIQVDKQFNTKAAGVYAIGDVCGYPALTPMAISEGQYLANRLFGKTTSPFAIQPIPTVVFTHPPLASVGFNESQAKERFGDTVKVYLHQFTALYTKMTEVQAPYIVKWVCAGPDETVVGCHALGIGADEIIQGFAAAIAAKVTRKTLLNTLAVHPTCAEEWLHALNYPLPKMDLKQAKKHKELA